MLEHQVRCSDLATWNQVIAEAFGDIEVAASSNVFNARLARRGWSGMNLMQVASSPARVLGARDHGGAGWFLLYNERGPCLLRQAGRETLLRDGELSLVRSDDRYDIRFEQHNRIIVAHLSSQAGVAALDQRIALRHGRDEAAVLGALLRRLAGLEAAAASALDAQTVRRAVVDLLVLAQPAASVDTDAVLLARLEAEVRQWLADPALDTHWLAHALGCSARHVQRLFEQRCGTTPGAYILEQRLQRAAALLREQRDLRIAEVALDAGFSDLSYFCRTFRRRFGCTAGQWRRLG